MRVISHYSRFLVIINVCEEDINHYKLLINHKGPRQLRSGQSPGRKFQPAQDRNSKSAGTSSAYRAGEQFLRFSAFYNNGPSISSGLYSSRMISSFSGVCLYTVRQESSGF
jgi:hypothetical protein